MKIALAAVAALVAIVAAILIGAPSDQRTAQPVTGLPWQIDVLPGGSSKVSGLTLSSSTMAAARERFGPDMVLAIVAAPGETGSLEAYYASAAMGVIDGKLILTAGLDENAVQRLRLRSPRNEYMESSTRKYALNPADMAFAYAAPVSAMTFIPAASFGADVVLRHFGRPAERIRTSEHVEHFLYPDKGLAVTLDDEGKELLQYVAPREFARLRDPLSKAGGKATASPQQAPGKSG